MRAAFGRADDIGAAEDARVRAGDLLRVAFVGLCYVFGFERIRMCALILNSNRAIRRVFAIAFIGVFLYKSLPIQFVNDATSRDIAEFGWLMQKCRLKSNGRTG